MEKTIKYSKELAVLYFKDSTPHTAITQLKRWICRNKELKTALDEAGYVNGQRILSPRQVELIFNYLGEPSGSS